MGRKRSIPDLERAGRLGDIERRLAQGDADGAEILDIGAAPHQARPAAGLVSREPRTICTTVIDTSGSMAARGALEVIARCLPQFKASVLQHSLLTRKLSWSVITFADTVQVVSPYQPVTEWTVPTELAAGSGTAMGTALLKALAFQAAHIEELAAGGIATQQYVMPFLSDGYPTAEPHERLEDAIRAIAEAEKDPRFALYPIAVEGANFDVMRRLTRKRPPLGLDQVDFQKFFRWLSVDVLRVASVSQPGQRIKVADPIKRPDNPEAWGYLS